MDGLRIVGFANLAQRAAVRRIAQQIDALTAPGDPPKSSRPTSAQILDEVNRLTAMPDIDQGYGTGETSIVSKSNLPDLATDADKHGAAATVPGDIETDPLAGDEEQVCVNCEQSQWLSPDGTLCYYCHTEQPAHRGGAKRVVELRCHPSSRIVRVR
jgi:hypothetical protein